jgi:hypothetical protein
MKTKQATAQRITWNEMVLGDQFYIQVNQHTAEEVKTLYFGRSETTAAAVYNAAKATN